MSGTPAKDALANVASAATASDSRAAVATPAKPGAPSPSPSPERSPTDIVFLGPPTADGAGVHVLRAREERLEAGELRTLQEGRPIAGEVLTLAPRKDNPRVCDVRESYAPPTARHASKGPAKVATDAYRDGWDEVFGKNPPPSRGTDMN